jgi:Ca2+-binding RTX toxin-like protein
MSKTDNKLSGAINLGQLGSTPLQKKSVMNLGDRDDLYQFSLNDRTYLDMLFTSKNGKYEIYKVKRPWKRVLKDIGNMDFRALRGGQIGGNLQRVNPGELEPGQYIIRVSQRARKARYQFQVMTRGVNVISDEPKKTVSLEKQESQPVLSVSDRFAVSGSPDGDSVGFEIDFSKNQDEDLRADYGLFRDAIPTGFLSIDGGYTPQQGMRYKNFHADNSILLASGNGGPSYHPGDLIAFKTATGETEYRSILLNEEGYGLCISFKAKAEAQADPDLFSSLKTAMMTKGLVIARRSLGRIESFLQGALQLETLPITGRIMKVPLVKYYLLQSQKDYISPPTLDVFGDDFNPFYQSGEFSSKFNIFGNDLDNVIIGSDEVDAIYGFKGNDQLSGIGGNDSIYGGEGNDTLYGGDDRAISGGQGGDILYGEEGDDKLYGGNGRGTDSLYGGDGNDYLDGEEGNDSLSGGNGSDTLYGGDGIDYLEGGDGDDNLYGNRGKYGDRGNDDILNGGDGVDSLYGSAGNDTLNGGDGVDSLTGYGRDISINSNQVDILIGGGGGDRFILSDTASSFYLESGDQDYAIIQDLQPGLDKIDIYGDKNLYSFEYKNLLGNSTVDIIVSYVNASTRSKDRIAIIQDTAVNIYLSTDFI